MGPCTKQDEQNNTVALVDDEEMAEIYHYGLTTIAAAISQDIRRYGFGAVNADADDAPDGFYLVQWTGKPHTLQAPAVVQGCADADDENANTDGSGVMPAGTLVCKGIYYDRVHHAPGWCEPKPDNASFGPLQKHVLFPITHALNGDLSPADGKPSTEFAPAAPVSRHVRHHKQRLKFVDEHRRRELLGTSAKIARSKMEPLHVNRYFFTRVVFQKV